ncbi:aminotransferase class I/II-fold pyridoxal phosphate-dependent enzyme [soil metagenome]
MVQISKLAQSVKASATLAAGAKARALRQQGIHVFDFSLGEPDFNTPQHICHAATVAMAAGQTHYTPSSGTPELKKAIAAYYARQHGLECGPENIICSNGAKHSIHNALVTVVGKGDQVIIPAPYWVSYSDLVEMAGAKPVLVKCPMKAAFKMTADQLKKKLTPKTRMLMLNSPSNPTGATYSRQELEALADVLEPFPDVTVLSDEIYEHLLYDDHKATCFATLRPWLKDRTLTISGASKSYAMTGWRLGWTIGPANVIKAMDNIQSQETSCPGSVTQAAMVVALNSEESPKCIAEMLTEFTARRAIVTEHLSKIKGVKYSPPDGAFYAFFDVSKHFGKTYGGMAVTDSTSFCLALLEQAHVNFVPGSAFGLEGFVRMSFACSRETITGGLDAFKTWMASGV